MGCLTTRVRRIDPLKVACERINPLDLRVVREDALNLATKRISDFGIKTTRKDALGISVTLICTISRDSYYLRVSPKETQWVNEWDTALYDVESNTHWQVD